MKRTKASGPMIRASGDADDMRGARSGALRVCLLGGFRVSVGTRSIEDERWRLRKARGVIKLLALAPNHRLHREQVTALLWPTLDAPSALNNLHHALHFARRTLEPAPDAAFGYLSLRDERLALCPDDPLWVDVEAFEEAAARARRVREPEAYRAALKLYAGELLPEDRYEDWAEGRRTELRTLYLALLAEAARIYEAGGDLVSATDALLKVVVHEPAHEEAHAGLIRLYAATGQRYQALRQYEQLEDGLRRELGAEPEASSRQLYEEILACRAGSIELPATGRLPERTAPHRHNLPVALTSFIGREREILEAESVLDETRLLTLTGAGGVGKTRLALEMARDLSGSYPDGAWLVELAALSEPDLMPQAVAGVLEVREQPGRSLMDTLTDALRSKEMLLVLDNCEHLVEDAACLVEALLSSCPGLRVLATSREVLGVAGEVNWVVRSLSLPPHEQLVPAGGASESVRLFVDRARRRQPGFELTEENAPTIEEICRRLDGVPLAVELAAARVGVVALEHISARLDDSLGLLTGYRTAAPRQQTLRATLDWSYELLGERERPIFGRLSVFAGGWTLEAAEAVGAGDGIEKKEILDLLSKLAHKSLVMSEAVDEGALRYRMLEPVRQYAHERLEEDVGVEAVRRRHADWCLGFARRAERGLSGPGQPEWIRRLETEQDNLRAALSWAIEHEPEMSLDLAVAQQLFWHTQGRRSEGRRWLEGAARNSATSTLTKAKALCVAGHMAAYQGDIEAARALAEDALSLSQEIDDKESIAYALVVRGLVAMVGDEDPGIALALEEEAMSLRPEIEDRRTLAFLLQFSGVVAVSRDDWGRAEALHEESLKLFREARDTTNVSVCLINFGLMAIEQANYERALERLRENLRVTSEADKAGIMHTLAAMAVATAALGQTVRAARLWGAAEAMREAHGLRLVPMPRRRIRHDEWLADARSRLDAAAWGAAWAEGKAMKQEEVFEYALSAVETPPTTMERPPDSALTRREQEVAYLISQGLANRRIAGEFRISERTVENHVAKILRKLGFHSRTQIATWVAEQHLP